MNKYFERFKDIVILQLDTEGFDKLTEKQKHLTYHLSNAGLWGRFISVQQGSKFNVPLFNNLIELHEKTEAGTDLHNQIHESLYILFAHNGIYHSTSGELLKLPLTQEALNTLKTVEPELINQIENIWFQSNIPQFRTIQTVSDSIDVIRDSGGNFYENLTESEVLQFRKNNYPQLNTEEVPPYGFNERLVKDKYGTISSQVISENGLYGSYVQKIIENLQDALPFTENEEQLESISTLIQFYRTGSAEDFDKHCIAWTKDKDSHIYFINGLIESYEDHY